MCNNKIEYVNKENCERQGFVKGPKGICKISVLERLYRKGRLDYGDKKYSAEDRLTVGEYFRGIYLKANTNSLVSKWGSVKVDCESCGGRLEGILMRQKKYLAAVKVVPHEFWPIVRLVCVENKLPEFDENLPVRRRTELAYLCYCDLCRGLDRLADYYCAKKQPLVDL